MATRLSNMISHLRPCEYAKTWLDSLPNGTTPQQAWDQCTYYSWMLWLISHASYPRPLSRECMKLFDCLFDITDLSAGYRGKFSSGKLKSHIESDVEVLRGWINGRYTLHDAICAKNGLLESTKFVECSGGSCHEHFAVYSLRNAALCVTFDYGKVLSLNAIDTARYTVFSADPVNRYSDEERQMTAKVFEVIRKHFPRPPIRSIQHVARVARTYV